MLVTIMIIIWVQRVGFCFAQELTVLFHEVQGAELMEYLYTLLPISFFLTFFFQLGESYKSSSCYCVC